MKLVRWLIPLLVALHLDTWYGDANLSQNVDGTDFFALAGHFGQSFSGSSWAFGDFNGDGLVDGTDFFTLAGNFGKSVRERSGCGAGAFRCPEPTSLTLLSLGGLLMFCLRRKSR